MGTTWTPQIEARLLGYRAKGLSVSEIAVSLTLEMGETITTDMVRNKLRRLDEREGASGRFAVAGLELIDYPATVKQVTGDAAICACVHVPQTDPEMWEKYLGIIARDQIPTAIIAGDIITGDMFSKWDVKEAWRWEAEVESLNRHLVPLAELVDQVVIIPGNHIENRIVKITGGQIRLKQVIDMANLPDALRAKIVTSDLDYLEYQSGTEKFLVAHSTSYSKIGGRVPVTYAEIYQAHVIAGNGHQIGHQVSPSGKYHGWDLGTMANPKWMGYVNRGLTFFPRMMQSFVTVRNGAVKTYGAGLPVTDWEAELD